MTARTEQNLTPAEVRSRAEAWHARQIAIIAKAHGSSWPKHKEWIEDHLKEEIRQRLHALGWRAKS